jgi:DNA polymerase I-like protein with 3'-5' exonuclease and polymerase domains
MIVIRPDWVPQNTGRLGTANPGTMNLSKEISDIFTVPKGWIMVEVDSGQIEPRLIQSTIVKDPQLKKCTLMYNDAYYGYVHYCTILTDRERNSGTLDLKPVEITEEMEKKRKKFKTFGNATMYGSTENNAGDKDKELFIRYIGGHPNRVALQSEVEKQINSGKRIFTTEFGTPINITKGPSENKYKDKTSNKYFSHLVRCAINNPIQGTAGDLMRESIFQADNLFRKKAPNSFILQYVHDAGKFAIHQSEYDKVIDQVKEITAYQIEDWIPIYSSVTEGVHEGAVKRFVY